MPRDPHVDALVGEIDQALIALQAARRIAADIQRSEAAMERLRVGGHRGRPVMTSPSIRYSGMTVPQAAARLGVSEEHIRRLLRSGELAGVAFGGRVGWRLPRESIEQVAELWEEQRRVREAARSRRPAKRQGTKRRR